MKLLLVVGKNVILVMCDQLSKIAYLIATTKEISAERLVRLFRDNMWKLYGSLENMILDKELQFVVELTKELNEMLEIEMRLLTVFYHKQMGK